MLYLVKVSWYVSVCFFRQKAACEMRISDWSSDVCSSDLIDICAIEARFYHFMVDHMKCPTLQCYYADWEDDGSGQGRIILEDMEKFGGKFGSSLDTNGVDGVAKGLEGLAVLHVIGRASCRERVCQYV